MREVLIFDFDGTLADTLEAGRLIFNQLAPDHGYEALCLEKALELRHLNLGEILKTLGVKRRSLPGLLRKAKAILHEQLDKLSPCPGVFEVLPAMREGAVKCGVLTSNSVENVEFFLTRLGVRHHFDFISSCPRLQGKARCLKAIARRFSVAPAQLFYVGDEVRDVKACRKAGVPVVGVTWGFNSRDALEKSGPSLVVDHPSELLAAILGSEGAFPSKREEK